MRGETILPSESRRKTSYFNPLAPCGARHPYANPQVNHKNISIHSPRAGRDSRNCTVNNVLIKFQSTRPVRGETMFSTPIRWHTSNFNPLAPCGARHRAGAVYPGRKEFQSTRPVRGETSYTNAPVLGNGISIHSPRAGRDAPCGARQQRACCLIGLILCGARRPVRGETMCILWSATMLLCAGRDAPCGARQQKRTKNMKTFCTTLTKNRGALAEQGKAQLLIALKVPIFSVRSWPGFLHHFHIAPHLIPSAHPQRHKTA